MLHQKVGLCSLVTKDYGTTFHFFNRNLMKSKTYVWLKAEYDKNGRKFDKLGLEHHLACGVGLHPFVGQCRAGDVAAQLFQRLPVVGRAAQRTAACRLNPLLSAHSAWVKSDSLGIAPCSVSTLWPARGPKAIR
jgi:hypothetical protein